MRRDDRRRHVAAYLGAGLLGLAAVLFVGGASSVALGRGMGVPVPFLHCEVQGGPTMLWASAPQPAGGPPRPYGVTGGAALLVSAPAQPGWLNALACYVNPPRLCYAGLNGQVSCVLLRHWHIRGPHAR